MSDNYSGNIDATDPQEPVTDKPIAIPDYAEYEAIEASKNKGRNDER